MNNIDINNNSNENQSASVLAQASPAKGDEFSAAFERRLKEILAVDDADLSTINLDVKAAVSMVIGNLQGIREVLGDASGFSGFDQSLVDGIEDYAYAAGQANSLYAIALAPPEDIVTLNEEAIRMREVLRSEAHTLVTRRLIPEQRVAAFKGLVGYRNVAFDLIDWTNLFDEFWDRIESKTGLSNDDLDKARQLAQRLFLAAAHRENGPAAAAEVARIRHKALTLLVRSYDEVRRAISFLRWREGDSETIAPSLYSGRGARRKSDPGELASPEPGTATPAAAAATDKPAAATDKPASVPPAAAPVATAPVAPVPAAAPPPTPVGGGVVA